MRVILCLFFAAFMVPASAFSQEPPSYKDALEIAAVEGDAEAQYQLGYLLAVEEINAVPRDYTEAVAWTRTAAEQGHARAQYNMGVFYYHGFGVPRNEDEAVKWWRSAAIKGNANAQYTLGYGFIVSRENSAEALQWWREEAARGSAGAPFYLGVFYHGGYGVPKDYEKALYWFARGAAQGDARAQNGLGAMVYNGQGTRKDYVDAYQWFNLAAGQGHPDAVYNRDLTAFFMSRQEIERAQDRAQDWLAKHKTIAVQQPMIAQADEWQAPVPLFPLSHASLEGQDIVLEGQL